MSHDEYTDYSCSTPIERLARDVETLLRTWHVTGSDRHVSFEHSHNPRSPYRKQASLPNLMANDSGCTAPPASPAKRAPPSPAKSRSTPTRNISRASSFHPSRMKQTSQLSDTSCIRLIRSETVIWSVSIDGGKVSVPLTLALWDGPSSSRSDTDLPHSLRRPEFTSMPPDPFGNFSTLFGVGQHITLSPQKLDDDLTTVFGTSVLQRHDTKTSPWVVTSCLSSLLQTALNVAVSNVQSRLPVFGLWGIYSPEQQEAHHDFTKLQQRSIFLELFPKWWSRSTTLPPSQRRRRLFSSKSSDYDYVSRRYIPPFLSANILPGLEMDSPTATFWVSVLPGRNLAADSRLTVWGQMLLRHCPPDTNSVVLCGARHVYTWLKPKPRFPRSSALFSNQDHIHYWRSHEDGVMDEPAESVDTYRRQCRRYAEKILEMASGATLTDPRWGPPDDPISSVHVTVTWNGRTKAEGNVEPLISLPFVIRSRHKMSRRDWMDMEDSVERTLLDPFNPSSFVVQTHYDKDISLTPLAASQRCILAALIRTATLPPEILLQHLTSEAVMDEWSSDNEAAGEIANRASLNQHTRQLVEAMDWTSIADDMIEQWEADHMVQAVFDGTITMGFPSPPEEAFVSTDDDREPFASLSKSAPPGRLLSLLFLHMSRLHAPSSMALVWMTFVKELRNCWDMKESLPNMGCVPGLDPPPEELKVKKCLSTIGLQASHAAFINSSEPDPDDSHCLIGQKLQVFNIGIESTLALEMQSIENMEKRKMKESDQKTDVESDDRKGVAPSVASTVIMNNATGEVAESKGRPIVSKVPVVDSIPNKRSFGAIAESPEKEELSQSLGSASKQEFFDAEEGKSTLGSITDEDSLNAGGDYSTSVAQRQNRKGARCPVHGVSLVASGDQLYAPYLQRPMPVTDDVILERRAMLSSHRGSAKLKVHERIEIAQRLQKPKLLSDMRAFKAANPGAVFQDFITWYGNPGNPLEDYGEESPSKALQPGESSKKSMTVMLDNASEAIQILTTTRDFFSDTWDEATPCPAIDQRPLFDVVSMVEMVLDSFETMHPASLVNQIMAVNLSTAYFTLVSSAGDTLHIGTVQTTLHDLRERTNHALELLARDVTHAAAPSYSDSNDGTAENRVPKYASLQAIRACDSACNALAAAEAILARATSILHKFPRQYDLVQTMLRLVDSEPIELLNPDGRSGILHVIHRQQAVQDNLPVPSLRDYTLRNTDEDHPCQLCVRFGDEGAFEGTDVDGGVMVALTKCYRD